MYKRQNLTSAALHVPEIIGGTPQNWGVPGYAHGPFSGIFFNGLLLGLTLLMYLPNLKFVALPVPEIIGGIPKNWGFPEYAYGPFLEIF